MNNIWLAFVTGLTTGGLSCLAVQGGLLASSMTSEEEKELAKSEKIQKVGMFLGAKLLAYTLLGLGLGALGSTLVLTPSLLGWMQIAAGVFMLGTAGNLLKIHPIFRYFAIQPPKFAYRLMRNEAKSKSLFAPASLGFLTVLIPCGVTQAMMALAVASANPFFGAGIMFAFTLGTSPIFFAVGMAALKLIKNRAFTYAASGAIVILGILSINTGLVLKGSPHTLQNYWEVLAGDTKSSGNIAGVNAQGTQEVTIEVFGNGYKASSTQLKAGVPVKLTLKTNNIQGCTRSFNIPTLKITKILPVTGSETIEFTPTKTGRLAYTCSMGMFSGKFEVI